MKCNSCHVDSPPGMKFCGACGTALGHICSKCNSPSPANFKFCGSCGNSFSGTSANTPPPPTPAPAPKDAERRHMTVMFCDVIGSTQLSARLDAEEFRRLIIDYTEAAREVIEGHGGHIAQYLGDGLMVYFGYPVALGDAPVVGVRCGLDLIDGMAAANVKWAAENKPQVDIRVGVHTGLVVVDDHLALGETCNVASRIQDFAPTNGVVMSSDTSKLVKGWFELESMGDKKIKGISKEMEIFRAIRESGARSSMDFVKMEDRTPLIGREDAVETLLNAWHAAQKKNDGVVILRGEAGIGKSRLIEVLKQEAEKDENLWLVECRCSPYHQHTPFYPIIDLLAKVTLQLRRSDSLKEKFKKIERFLKMMELNLNDTFPLFAQLLSLPIGESKYTMLQLTSEEQKEKTKEMLMDIIRKRTSIHNVLFIIEDLHWIDPSTLELVNKMIELDRDQGTMTVLTHRPEFKTPWNESHNIIDLPLENLTRTQTLKVIHTLTQGKPLPDEVLEQIVEKTDGIPLFVEELTKMVLESGLLTEEKEAYILSGPLPPLAIPATLQDSLIARLDRFSSAKEVIQVASVLGKSFSYDVLVKSSLIPEEQLQDYLQQLVAAGMFFTSGTMPNVEYQFQHALVQNAAYESMLRSKRQRLHQRISVTLIEHFPSITVSEPELLANHLMEAGLQDQAVEYWQNAVEQSIKASAYLEATHFISKGLEAVNGLSESTQKIQFELAFRVRNSTIIKIQDGWATDRVKEAYDKCFELCKQVGAEDSEELFNTLFGIWAYYVIAGNIRQSYKIAEDFTKTIEGTKNIGVSMQAKLMLGNSLFWLGRQEEAMKNFEALFAQHEVSNDADKQVGFGHDTRVTAYMLKVWSHWMRGEIDIAIETNKKSITLAQELNHPFTEAIARCTAAWFYHFMRDVKNTFQEAQSAIDLGFPAYTSYGHLLKGWAIAASGKPQKGLKEAKHGYQILKDQGSGLQTYPSIIIAEIAIMCEDYNLAQSFIDLGIAAVKDNGEGVFEGELYRLAANVKQATGGDHESVVELLQTAIQKSKDNGSYSLAFRAVLALESIAGQNGAVDFVKLEKNSLRPMVKTVNYEKFLKKEKLFL